MPPSPRTPALLLPALMEELEFHDEVIEARREASRLGNTCEALSLCYRSIGTCYLTGEGDTSTFFDYLIQSALTRRHYLSGAGQAAEPEHRRAGLIDPVFDAMAARQWRLAGEITALAAQEWTEGEEYEDDFCYAAAIRELLAGRDAAIPPLLVRWEQVLDGQADARLDIVRAMLGADAAVFANCLAAFLQARDDQARSEGDPVDGSLSAELPSFFPERWVCVEGLALLALLERRGLSATGEFLACPPMAREAEPGAFQSRGFPHVLYLNE